MYVTEGKGINFELSGNMRLCKGNIEAPVGKTSSGVGLNLSRGTDASLHLVLGHGGTHVARQCSYRTSFSVLEDVRELCRVTGKRW